LEAKKQGWNWSFSWDKVESECKKKIEEAKETFEKSKKSAHSHAHHRAQNLRKKFGDAADLA